MRSDRPTSFVHAAARHHDIETDKVRAFQLKKSNCLRPIDGRNNSKAFTLQDLDQAFTGESIVFGNQYFHLTGTQIATR